jgi:transcriptional regulator with XRE-family HTH domain
MQRSAFNEREALGLAGFLKRARRRIHSETRSLGQNLRFPSRLGKAVTQEEVAEAVGISRNWYQMLETKQGLRVSPTLLGRIADVLMLSASERVAIFELAVPELRATILTPAAGEVLEAFRSLRSLGQKLWTATTEVEALTLVREYGTRHFTCDLFASRGRRDTGAWDDHIAIGKLAPLKLHATFDSFARANYDSVRIDEMQHATILVQPGDLLARSDLRYPFSESFAPALDFAGLNDFDFITARVRSRLGFVASLGAVHVTPHQYAEVEREHLSTVAQLVSHALSAGA